LLSEKGGGDKVVWSNDKIIEQINSLWKKMGEIEKRLESGGEDFEAIKGDIVEIKTQLSMISANITGFMGNTWKLIFGLVAIVAGLVGIKLWTT
jgi:archaellum component FlaC